jgi:hypothetical protein
MTMTYQLHLEKKVKLCDDVTKRLTGGWNPPLSNVMLAFRCKFSK